LPLASTLFSIEWRCLAQCGSSVPSYSYERYERQEGSSPVVVDVVDVVGRSGGGGKSDDVQNDEDHGDGRGITLTTTSVIESPDSDPNMIIQHGSGSNETSEEEVLNILESFKQSATVLEVRRKMDPMPERCTSFNCIMYGLETKRMVQRHEPPKAR